MVKSVRDWVNYIWHKTDSGDYIRLEAKNINNANPLVCQHWEPVLHVLKQEAELQHENQNNALISRVYWDSVNETARAEKQNKSGFIAPNRNKSIQTGIKERKEIQKKIQTVENVIGLNKMLSIQEVEGTSTELLDEHDDELYGD